MQWFRMYAEMPDDPKIGTLSDAAFRTWVELLCCACKAESEGDTGLKEADLNWALRRNVTETLQELLQKHLVTISETNTVVIRSWNKRQYVSDNSTERVRKYREKNKNKDETLPKRSCNGTDTETDTEKKRTKTHMPKDFDISERVRKWATDKGHKNLPEHMEHFKLTAAAKGYKYVDWDKAFMKAVMDNWAKVYPKAESNTILDYAE